MLMPASPFVALALFVLAPLLAAARPQSLFFPPTSLVAPSNTRASSSPAFAAPEETASSWWTSQDAPGVANMDWFGAMPATRGIRLAQNGEERMRTKVMLAGRGGNARKASKAPKIDRRRVELIEARKKARKDLGNL